MELIKKLREISGAGMMDCKKALEETDNDLEAAMEFLRKKGIAKAAKRDGREAHEGVIELYTSGNEGYMVEINSETDFVAKNERFRNLAKEILEVIKTNKPANIEELAALAMNGMTVKEGVDSLSGIIGEKIVLKRFAIVSGGSVAAYSHMGGKLGVLLALDTPQKGELAMDMAMQVAATNPLFITPKEVPMEKIEKEKEIEREVLAKEGKPAAVIEKILEGKINKYFENNCLVKQEYIKNDKEKIEKILNGVKITKFERFSL